MPDRFDIIVVGAGSAGCVLANRLSEDPLRKVLLIEAGPDYPSLESLPDDIAKGLDVGHSQDWGYASEPGAAVCGRSIPLIRGKLTGGCSAVNVTFAMRGWPDDYDGWAQLGIAGWSFDDVLPYFRRLEHDLDFDNEWHGQSGPLPIRRHRQLSETHEAFVDACVALGHRRIEDHNQPGEIGVGPVPVNTVEGVRLSTALTYLAQARSRPNLTVLADTLIDRVALKDAHAVGVVTSDGETILGDRVVLAGGSYASPAILMRSGIGDLDQLQRIGIEVSCPLPGLGEALIEHPLIGIVFHTDSELPQDAPGVQTMLSIDEGDQRFHIFPWHQPSGSDEPDIYAIIGGLLTPRSRGTFRIDTTDPHANPRIELGLLSDRRDVDALMHVVRTIWRISQTPPLSRHLRRAMIDGWVEDDDKRLEAFVRETVEVYNHPVATCRMGSGDLAVVDHEGRVRGVENLWVIDASIMPSIPTCQTNVPTMMIAEKLSETVAA